MAAKRAAPKTFGTVHPEYLTPSVATVWMGVISVAWYIGLKLISDDVLYDAVAGLGMMIAFYYGITGFACPVYFRRELHSRPKPILLTGVAPTIGGIVLFVGALQVHQRRDQPEPGGVDDLARALRALGGDRSRLLPHRLPAHFGMWTTDKTFFHRRPEVAPPGFLDAVAPEPEPVADASTF